MRMREVGVLMDTPLEYKVELSVTAAPSTAVDIVWSTKLEKSP